MGEADRYQEYRKNRKTGFSFGEDGNSLMNLFIINVIFFLLLMVAQVAYYYFEQTSSVYNQQVVQWFGLPASLTRLSERPWTLLTYMFSDTGSQLIRIISNMIWLWAFGYLLQQMSGNDKLIPIYIYGGLLGGIVFIAASYLLPTARPYVESSWLLGANASTMAVAAAATTLSPTFKFFRQIGSGISIWILLTIYIVIDIAGVASSPAQSLSHLGGAAAGFLFVLLLRKGKDGSIWMNNSYRWFMGLFDPNKKGHSTDVKDTVFYKTGNREPFSKTPNITQQRVDEILDKINQKGYHFLTDEEKEILRKAAEDKNL